MQKLLKLVIGLLLLPLCLGAATALWRIFLGFSHSDTVWIPLAAGALGWVVIYCVLPRPMWLYVLGHELTHAIWTWLFGGRVGKLDVGSRGGQVEVSKTNFIIALAPYFFPFYVVVVVLLFLVLAHVAWPWDRLELWFLVLLGAAYAFHVTLTAHVLKTRQSDITEHGYLFSGVVIFIGNAVVLLLGIPLLTSNPSIPTAFTWCWEETVRVFLSVHGWIA